VPVRRLDGDEWLARHAGGESERVRAWLLAMFAYYDRYGLPAGSLPLQALLGRPATPVREVLHRELSDLSGPHPVIAG
jgi:hypothetical protein